MYVTRPVRYSTLKKGTLVRLASLDSGVPAPVLKGTYNALMQQVDEMLFNGHACYMPGIGYLRLSLSAKAVQNKENVGVAQIRCIRILLRPSGELREAMDEIHATTEVVD